MGLPLSRGNYRQLTEDRLIEQSDAVEQMVAVRSWWQEDEADLRCRAKRLPGSRGSCRVDSRKREARGCSFRGTGNSASS
jgi:hypothetical protein